MGGTIGAENENIQKTDTAETIHISSLALLKMLKHSNKVKDIIIKKS